MLKDMGGNDGFEPVTLTNDLIAKQIGGGARIPENSLAELRFEIFGKAGQVWTEGGRLGFRLWIIQEYYPAQTGGAVSRPIARVYEDVLNGVTHVRGPASFYIAPNIRLMKYFIANPTATQTVYARIRYAEVTTQNLTKQRMMYTITDLPTTETSNIALYGSMEGRTAPLDLKRVQWIGTGPTTATGRVLLQAGNSYYSGTPSLTGVNLAKWAQYESGMIRDLPPIMPTNSPVPNIFQLQNDTPDTLHGELWFYGD